ncbi:hypothetical protein Acr_00g0006260 [Actinidia rufa]|uniref:Uncharacterized protein n=1 Tax=Actinidia rufa TaxID=165716 RepID=A0A7J0D7Z4_9ERIC|nr:hypothetical protein Acr_00g0006260 [Actinidia rufa]
MSEKKSVGAQKCNPWGITRSTQHVVACKRGWGECTDSREKSVVGGSCDVTGDKSLGTTIGIRAKFESPESHWTDFDSDWKPISNSDQIQSAQKEVRQWSNLRALIMLLDADYAPGKPRMRNEMNKKMIGHIRQCIGHEHDEMSAHGLWTKLEEMYREKTSQNKALMRRLVLMLQKWTTVAELTSEFQRKGQRKGPDKKVKEEVQIRRRDKKNCPRNKAQDQSSEAATTTMMAVDESDVLLAALADEESDWISDSGNAYHLCRDREVFSIHVACEGLVRIANNTTKSCWKRNSPVSHGRREIHEGDRGNAAREGRLKSYTDWRKVSRQEALLSDIGPVVLARRMDEKSNRCTEARKASAGISVQEYLEDLE